MIFCDSHIHLANIENYWTFFNKIDSKLCLCTCSLTETELNKTMEIKDELENALIFSSFGVHPKFLNEKNLKILEELLILGKIDLVGEIGFDFSLCKSKENILNQQFFFEKQLNLAIEHKKTVILHLVKATDFVFKYIKELKKLPCVVFHSCTLPISEAFSILDKGINAYFSLGKQMLKGNKKGIILSKELPFDRLLLETDEPFQKIMGHNLAAGSFGHESTNFSEIQLVYNYICENRQINIELLWPRIYDNFCNAFCNSGCKSR